MLKFLDCLDKSEKDDLLKDQVDVNGDSSQNSENNVNKELFEVVSEECVADEIGYNKECEINSVDNGVDEGDDVVIKNSDREKIDEEVQEKEKDNNEQIKNKPFAVDSAENIIDFEKNLLEIPTEIDENGNEVVVFDEIMDAEGSKRLEKTICAYFVGYGMSVNELRYNLRRMWSRCGFKDIVDSNNGIFFIKFNNDEGIEYVVNNGPWLVKSKPLIVQKWDINMCLDKTEPEVIPLWIKLCNVPLEAWTTKGISALASRIGKPVKMDVTTASMCKMGVGRVGYARVLVEVSAKKPLPYNIDVVYKNEAKEIICRKNVKNLTNLRKEQKGNGSGEGTKNESFSKINGDVEKGDNEGFIPVKNRKAGLNGKVLRPNYKPNTQQPRKTNAYYEYQPKKKGNNVSSTYESKVQNEKAKKNDNATQMNPSPSRKEK
ncbi:zinc knuckle CX2CX4HX4C containing protein [Tanacetum coccineum]